MKKDQFTINLNEINFDPGDREDFGDMLELKDSISRHTNIVPEGILQPILVELLKDGRFNILDGRRRYKACKELSRVRIPAFVVVTELDALDRKEIEYDATEQHKHFDFVERSRIIKKIHDLMIEKHGKKTSTAADAKGWTMDDTAKKLGKSRASVSNALEMMAAVDIMPELAEAKNESDARKLYKQAEGAILRELTLIEIREKRELLPIDKRRIEIENTFIVGDCEVEVLKIADASQDLVEIDWPFSINLEDYREDYEDIPKEDYLPFVKRVLSQAKRILKSTGWLIVWYASEPWQEVVFLEIKKLGLRTRRVPGFWEKEQGETKRPELFLSLNQETFYYAGGLDAKIVRQGRSNRWNQAPVPHQYKIHRTQKPVTLYEDIFSTFVMPGTTATVMFAGSGNALLAGDNLGMNIKGFDIKEIYKRGFINNVHKGKPGMYVGWET